METKRFFWLLIILNSFASVYAEDIASGDISYNGYSRKAGAEYVIGAGLEWARWDRTSMQIVDWDDNSFIGVEGDGWRLATHQEMADLVNQFDLGGEFDTDPTTRQDFSTPYDPFEDSGYKHLVELFGYTEDPYGLTETIDPYYATGALFGGEEGLYSSFYLVDDYSSDNVYLPDGSWGVSERDAWAYMGPHSGPGSHCACSGAALVRSVSSVPVPELNAQGVVLGVGFLFGLLAFSRERWGTRV